MNGKLALTETLRNLEVAISSVPMAELPGLLGLLEKVKAMGWGRMLAGQTTGPQDDGLLTIPDVARRLQVSTYRAYELARHGQLKTVRLGKSVRVKPEDLAAYIAQQGTGLQ